jgi:hypothetical protein
MVLSHESPLYSYKRGYLFTFLRQVAAGTEIEITGPPVETGACDMWPVEYIIPASVPVTAGGPITEDMYDTDVSGYIHESDLRPPG